MPQRQEFNTTHWSVVLAARGESAQAQVALEKLCRVYWYPLYAFVRRQGQSPEEAEDLIQGFFARLLQRKDLETVQRERGRFRSYLLAAEGRGAARPIPKRPIRPCRKTAFDDELLVAVEPTGQADNHELQSVHSPILPNRSCSDESRPQLPPAPALLDGSREFPDSTGVG